MRALAWDAFLADDLAARARDGLLRTLRPLIRDGAFAVTEDGRRLLNLSSNDYLGLSSHPAVLDGTARGAGVGAGATSSRLIVGTDPAVQALEDRLAAFQGTEAALVFGSGYLANVGTISALVGPGDAVVSDALNHASMIDGCRLSGATIHRYGHLDLDQLEAALERAARARASRILIVTESVFSMDGDMAPLAEIAALKERHGAALLVDEAHAGGVFGAHGSGLAHELGVASSVDLHLGTFSKAFGAYGAYVAGDARWIRLLVNASRSFVFTTALPPAVIGAVGAALDVVHDADDLRADLRAKAARFRDGVARLGLDACGSSTQIVPAVAGTSDAALALSRALEDAGFLAVAIRPPTVPAGSARIRFSLTAAHEQADLDRALEALSAAVAAPPTAAPARAALRP